MCVKAEGSQDPDSMTIHRVSFVLGSGWAHYFFGQAPVSSATGRLRWSWFIGSADSVLARTSDPGPVRTPGPASWPTVHR